MREAQNAKDLTEEGAHGQILAIGDIGSGKTTLFRTLKGKKFAYLFDPNAAAALRGADIDYLEFLPERTDIDLAVKTLRKEGGSVVGDKQKEKAEPRTYLDWEQDFTERLNTGFFEKFDWLMFDSMTSFSEIVMDRAQFLNNSLGKQPDQADFSTEMTTVRNVIRVAASRCRLYATAHVEVFRDETTGKVTNRIMFIGKNRIRIPMRFADIFVCEADVVDGKPRYQILTMKNRENSTVRTSLKNLKPVEDVTIDWSKTVEGQGLGKWF